MSDLSSRLRELKALVDEGLLTAEEFAREKEALLAARRSPTPAARGEAGGTTVQGPRATAASFEGGTTVDPPAAPVPPSTGPSDLPAQVGSYRVLGVLGAGGMGTVVRARHGREGWARRQGGDVAIKLIHPHIAEDPAFQERFFDEAQLGKQIHHPRLAAVHDVIEDGAWLGIVMELVEGQLLSEHPRGPPHVLGVGHPAASGGASCGARHSARLEVSP
jgi:hypothetical protein